MQLKYSNYVAFSHFHGKAVNNSGLFMSIAIIIIRTKKTSRKNSQILHKVMQLPVDEEKERSYTILEEME